ncbi:hypothetical protein L249_4602 [Ophiocordyceps polyrhachis-furcata BCC 54312]|uniref:Nascent polypeptide-associated complex subunit alpha-like UBA domain-containing protein n=1 Tax=Ophiocordyceps polyrhachis-furcata BCC 54312 TaxID=1330021 RepID=A0A367LBY6_9HYPO|nr:hypothetical protein L249_4602 [Ophiocordyceps polyrhachis-furcata BCC 54312]
MASDKTLNVAQSDSAADEEVPATAKSAEDRKAASALASLDANHHDDDVAAASAKNLDRDAVDKAIKRLGGAAAAASAPGAKTAAAAPSAKNVKVDAADVTLLVDELELSRPKATELLRNHDGDAIKAMRAYMQPSF